MMVRMRRAAATFLALGVSVLAAGCGGGHMTAAAVDSSACGPVESQGKGKPDYLIVSDLPLRAPPGAREQVAGIEYLLRQRHFTAGKYSIGYQSCDDSSAASSKYQLGRCGANTKAYAADPRVVGVIGPYNSECAALEIPIANAAPKGPLAMIGAGPTDPQLTARIPNGDPGTPGKFYPTGVRNFVRLTAPDQFQAAAAVLLARRKQLKRVFVLDDGEPYGQTIGAWFKRDAARVGVPVVGSATWDQHATSYTALAERVAAAHPDGVYLSGFAFLNGGAVLKELRRVLGSRVVVFAPDGFADVGTDTHGAGAAANGLLATFAGVTARDAGPLGVAVQKAVGRDETTQYGALYGAAAASVLLDAIAASDGTRASVTRQLFAAHTPAGLIGRFGFDREGDPTVGAMTVLRIAHGRLALEPTLYPTAALAKG
jgi:branched-chain amino acid transport system substrate-binding protein